MDLKGKVIVVTGGGSGIGAAMLRRFAREGAAGLVAVDLNEDGAQSVAAALGGLALRCDVTVEHEVQDLVARVTARFGRIDVFCSNAGLGRGAGLDAPNAQWQTMWDLHVMAHVYAARAVLPQMLERGEGYLLHTASAAGLLSHPESATYAVSKHAAVSFAEWLSIAYGDRGVRVSCLCPQGVLTPMLLGPDGARKTFLLDGAIEADRVADEVVQAMREERFLVLPHPEVLDYLRRKTADVDRWLVGMRKLRTRAEQARSD